MARPTSFDAEHQICAQEIYLCSHKLNSPNSLPGSDTQTHPHIADRKGEEKRWQKATAEGAGENSILNMPGEDVQANCLAYAMYKWMAIYWKKERNKERKNNCKHLCLLHVYKKK